MVPGNRLSLFVETSGESVIPIGTIHVVLNVFLPGPHDLHGTVDVLRDLDSANDAIGLQPSAEAAADQMVVDHDLIQRQPSDLCSSRLDARDGLAADPDFAAVLAHMNRAVHRLHRRVG
jgi:hypothetical protein